MACPPATNSLTSASGTRTSTASTARRPTPSRNTAPIISTSSAWASNAPSPSKSAARSPPPLTPAPFDDALRALLESDQDRLSGITPIDPGFPDESCAKIEKWIRNGPCIGIKYVGGNKTGVACSHPNNDPIIRLAAELDATIYIHTWLKVGGTPRLPGRDNLPGESTPMDVVALARRFPNARFICGHSGGDWELGVRVVRPHQNVLLEFAGSDPHSGSVDYAVKELGADRIVWGGHGPSRSYATELGKVLDADLARADRMKVFGANFRQLAAPIFKRKGRKLAR